MPVEIGSGRFHGRYQHKVDEKGRLPIPFRWRPAEESTEITLIVWRKHQVGTCLRALLPEQWLSLLADIEAMPNRDPNKSVLKRSIGTSSYPTKLDSVGRITIPDEMARAAEIKSEALLAGMVDRFEIWSPKRYAQVEAMDNAIVVEALKEMQ